MKEEQKMTDAGSGNVNEQNLNAVKEYIKEHCDNFVCFLMAGNGMSAYTNYDKFEDICRYLLGFIFGIQDERVRVSWMAVLTEVVLQGAVHDKAVCRIIRGCLLEDSELRKLLGLRMEEPANDEPSDITLN